MKAGAVTARSMTTVRITPTMGLAMMPLVNLPQKPLYTVR